MRCKNLKVLGRALKTSGEHGSDEDTGGGSLMCVLDLE